MVWCPVFSLKLGTILLLFIEDNMKSNSISVIQSPADESPSSKCVIAIALAVKMQRYQNLKPQLL